MQTKTREVRVKDTDDVFLINAADFDPEVHEDPSTKSSKGKSKPKDSAQPAGDGGEGTDKGDGGGEGDSGTEGGEAATAAGQGEAKVYTVTALRKMTRDELDELAKRRELEVPDDANKPDVVNLILEAQAGE